MKNPLTGNISISRPSSSHRDDHFITIEVTDELSRVQFVEIEIPAQAMILALTGLACQPCQFELRCVNLVGMQAENTTADVFVPDGEWDKRDELAQAALDTHPLTLDGWKGDLSDATNSHRCIKHEKGGSTYRVHFRRHVPAARDRRPAETEGRE